MHQPETCFTSAKKTMFCSRTRLYWQGFRKSGLKWFSILWRQHLLKGSGPEKEMIREKVCTWQTDPMIYHTNNCHVLIVRSPYSVGRGRKSDDSAAHFAFIYLSSASAGLFFFATKAILLMSQLSQIKFFFTQKHGVWKSQKKSHSTLRVKRATFTFWVDKSWLKMPKMVHFGDFLKTWSLRSNSVTRQKLVENAKI